MIKSQKTVRYYQIQKELKLFKPKKVESTVRTYEKPQGRDKRMF